MKPVLTSLLLLVLPAFHIASGQEASAPAKPTIKIVALEIPWLLHTQTPGPYNDLMDELFLGFDRPLEVSIMPVRRALREFFGGPAHCYFAGNYNETFYELGGLKRDDVVYSKPFNLSSIRIFTPVGEPAISSLKELGNRHVSIDAGVGAVASVRAELPKSTATVVATSVEQSHAMLAQGRVTAAIMVHYDYRLFSAHDQTEPKLHFNDQLVFREIEDKLMCKPDVATNGLVQHVNNRIDALARSGDLAQTLAPDYARSRRQFAKSPHPYLLLYQPSTQ